MRSYWFSHEGWIISPTSLVESEIWYGVVFAFCTLIHRSSQKPFIRERYPLPQVTQTVMRSLRLACQVQCNWLGRLKWRYHSALLIRMWRGSHVPKFISTLTDSLGMETFYKTLCGQGGRIKGSHTVNCFQVAAYRHTNSLLKITSN